MPWSETQSASAFATVVGTAGETKAFTSNVTAGDVIVAAGFGAGASLTPTFSDSQSNVWTTLGTVTDTTFGVTMAVGFAIAGSSAACTPKLAFNTGSSIEIDLWVGDFVPPAGAISQDGTAQSVIQGGTTGATITTPPANGTGSTDLLINLLVMGVTWQDWEGSWVDMGATQNGCACGALLNAAGTSAPDADANTSGNWSSLIVALQPGSVTPPDLNVYRIN